ncbi:helix-turn-helix domain-containing protein [Chitinophaga niabensis]|uniref:helix-turn-helix domain-containing protein n=1 Tax=Chitinophaga niabensis TaxID=536979 RepID=UPI0031BBC232
MNSFTLLNTDYVQLNKSWHYNNIKSIFYRLYYIDGGEGKLYNDEGAVTLEDGYLYLIPSFTTCNYECRNELSQYYVSFMEESADGISLFAANRKIFKQSASAEDINCVKRILSLNPNRAIKTSYNPRDYEKSDILRSYQDMNNLIPPAVFMETCGLILQLLSRFMAPENFRIAERTMIHPKVMDAINFIQSNLLTNITVEGLAQRANQHPDYFSRLFLKNTGERPLAYVQLKRVERVQLLLITTDLPFYKIAEETGFESLSYLSRVFRNHTGQTLSDYKRQNLISQSG